MGIGKIDRNVRYARDHGGGADAPPPDPASNSDSYLTGGLPRAPALPPRPAPSGAGQGGVDSREVRVARIVAERVLHARPLAVQVERDFAALPAYAADAHLRGSDPTPKQIMEEARRAACALPRGGNVDEIAARLASERGRQGALVLVTRLWNARNAMRLVRLGYTLAHDRPQIDHVRGYIGADVERWIREGGVQVDSALLNKAVDDYIAYFLHTRRGERFVRLTYDPDALEYAIIRMRREVADPADDVRLTRLVPRLIHFLINQEARRARSVSGAEAQIGEAGRAAATPLTRQVRNLDGLQDVIGPGLTAEFNAFYDGLRTNAGGIYPDIDRAREVAVAFFELFFNYVRYFVNTYGDHAGRELPARGIEVALLHAIFMRVENPGLYDDDTLSAFREFFVRHVRAEEPELTSLRPPRGARAPDVIQFAANGAHYVPYDGEMDVRGFLSGIRAWSPSYRTQFEAAAGLGLDTFLKWGAIQERPPDISEGDWLRHVEAQISSGHREDVTTEPYTYESWDAIYPAYRFLQRLAAVQGQVIDFFDFLCAIFPVARRLRQQAVDGVINITAPGFMRAVDWQNWDISSWAREIRRRAAAGELPTATPLSTVGGHGRGDARHPTYETLRGYSAPLAAARHGGIAHDAATYEFLAGLLRWKELIEIAMQVHDGADLLLTHPARDAASGFSFRIEYDTATYQSGESPINSSQRAIFQRARAGFYRRQLNMVRDYLEGLRMLPPGVIAQAPDGSQVDFGKLEDELCLLDEAERTNTALLRDRGRTWNLGDEDAKRMCDAYARTQGFVDRVVLFTCVSGDVETLTGQVRYQTAPFPSADSVYAASTGRVVVPVNLLVGVAREMNFSREQFTGLLRVAAVSERERVIRGAVVNADTAGLVEVARQLGTVISDDIFAAYTTVVERMREGRFEARLPRLQVGRQQRTSLNTGPFLPAAAPVWEVQFREFARGRVRLEDIPNSVRAIREYFYVAPGFTHRFYPEALREAIDAFIGGSGVQERVYQVVVEFLRTIAVASETISSHETSRVGALQIAEWAAESYLNQFPGPHAGLLPEEVPVDRDLLMRFVALELGEHRDLAGERSSIYRIAMGIVGRHNDECSRARAGKTPPRGVSTIGGLLDVRIRESEPPVADMGGLARAHFELLQRVERGERISRDDVAEVFEKIGVMPSRMEVDFLDRFMREEAVDIERLRKLVADPDQGFARYVYHTDRRGQNLSAQRLEEFAMSVFVPLILQNNPVDVRALSMAAVAEGFSPVVTERMAEIYRIRLATWAERLTKEMEAEVLEDARLALDVAADEDERPAGSFEEYIGRATEEAGLPSFSDVLALDRARRTLMQAADPETSRDTPLLQTARQIYERKVRPRRQAYKRKMKELQAELAKIEARAEDVVRRSLEIYQDMAAPRDVAGMDEGQAAELGKEVEAGIEILLSIRDEMDAVVRLKTKTEGVEGGPRVARLIDESVRAANEHLTRAEYLRDRIEDAARARVLHLKEERARKKALTKAREHAAKTARAVAELGARRKEIERAVLGFVRVRQGLIESDLTKALYSAMDAVGSAHEDFDKFDRAVAALAAFETQAAQFLSELASIERQLGTLQVGHGETQEKDALLEAATRELDAALGFLGRAAAEIAWHRSEIQAVDATLTGDLARAEARLPITPALGIPEPSKLPETDEGFNAGEPSKDLRRAAQEKLGPISRGRIMSRRAGSCYLAEAQVPQVKKWMDTGRADDLLVRDVFGNEVRLLKGERGIRLTSRYWEDVPQTHPFAAMIDVLMCAVANATRETEIVSRLAGRALGGNPQAGALFQSLLALLSRGENSGDVAYACGLTRRWAVANRDALKKLFGVVAADWFADVPRPQETARQGPPIYGDRYNLDAHNYLARKAAFLLGHPEVMAITLRTPTKTFTVYTDGLAAVKVHREGGRVYTLYDLEFKGLGEVDVSHTFEITDISSQVVLRELGDGSPEYAARTVLCYLVYTDPELMELGWLIHMRKGGELHETFVSYLDRILQERSQYLLRGEDAPVTLRRLQDTVAATYEMCRMAGFIGAEISPPEWAASLPPGLLQPKQRLNALFPEHRRVRPEFVRLVRSALGDAPEATGNLTGGYNLLARHFPDLKGAMALDLFAVDFLGREGITGTKEFYSELGATFNHNAWFEQFVRIHTDLRYIRAMRRFLSSPLEAHPNLQKVARRFLMGLPGETLARLATGVDAPWLPQVTPQGDAAAAEGMSEAEIEEMIDGLNAFPPELGASYLIAKWREGERQRLKSNKMSRQVIEEMSRLPNVYVKMMLIFNAVDPSDRLRLKCESSMRKRIREQAHASLELVQFVFGFMLENRDRVIAGLQRGAKAKTAPTLPRPAGAVERPQVAASETPPLDEVAGGGEEIVDDAADAAIIEEGALTAAGALPKALVP